MELTARLRHEDDSYWAEVIELPGCFASGDTLDELRAALGEAVTLYLASDQQTAGEAGNSTAIEIAEMKLFMGAAERDLANSSRS